MGMRIRAGERREPAVWFLVAAALAMTLWCALFFDQIVIALRQIVGFALAGAEGWTGARLASQENALRPWAISAIFALLGSGVSLGILRRRRWAARALLLLWFATVPVIGILIHAGLSAGGLCLGRPTPFSQLRCLGVIGPMAIVPVALWLIALWQIRCARACWGARV